jgi:VIT1/CCC1 family predicted Fe2+/Mn2+ transporter
MDSVLWIAAWMLAVAFVAVGLLKLLTPYERVATRPGFGWAREFSAGQVRMIGLVELLGGLGLVLPPLLGVGAWLVPLAAAGLALDMLGALATHIRRHDPRALHVPPIALGALALCVAIGRYWVEPF